MWSFKSCWELVASLLLSNVGRPQYPLPLTQQPTNDLTVIHGQAPSTFQCSYPAEWESCNTPDNRGCWIKKRGATQPLWNSYTIDTVYEKQPPPPGVLREYWIEVEEKEDFHPDGYIKHHSKLVNGTYPGPTIEACWGDDIVVHVTNKLQDNGTTIHWHGVRQLHTNEMDGVNGVTQCPIVDGETFTYRFKAEQYGHSWYHSHYSIQYADGVAGPLLIHGPTSADWDEEWDPLIMTDWVHETSSVVFLQELNGNIPLADSILLDGHGNYTCSQSDPRCVGGASHLTKTFEKGKKYLLRLINGSAGSTFIFSIDGHRLQVISTDFVPIKPYFTDHVLIGIGQRYSVIVEADPETPSDDGNYWIRTSIPDVKAFPGGPGACGNVNASGYDETRGIIRYNPQSTADPSSAKQNYTHDGCQDEPIEKLVPIVPWTVEPPQNNVTLNTYEAAQSETKFHDFIRWELTDTPMWLNFSNPTILNLKNSSFDPQYSVVDYDYDVGFVYLVVTTNLTRIGNNKTELVAAHPIHLHGHDFAIIAQSSDPYDEQVSPQGFNFSNPARRDVALLPAGGYLAIAFKPDNPGVWLLHCHIAWHASSGLALQIIENQEEILNTIGTLTETQNVCKSWDARKPNFTQDDSGV